ncbi:MAG: hypothetical protein LBU81_01885 [Methanosarcinales archaeon]|nr:hypothetical protein [Methanosarcinales archaeon]
MAGTPAPETNKKVQIRIMISRSTAAELDRKAKLMNMSRAAVCRLVWNRVHQELQNYDHDFSTDTGNQKDQISAKKWKVLLVQVSPEMRDDLKRDAEKIGCSMSCLLRETLEAFLKEVRIRE